MRKYIDRYIIAEATRTLPLTDPTQQFATMADTLWLGCTTILAEGGLCINTIQLYPDDENGGDEITVLEIQDLTLDPRFKTRDYVVNYPHLRFYAGTPLRTKRGYNIGSVCVVDSSPRVLSIEEKRSLCWMGKLIMQHLEMTAERCALRQNQRMVASLGRFVAGKNTLTDDTDRWSGLSSEVQLGDVGQRSESSLTTTALENPAGTLEETFSRAAVLVRGALMTDGVSFVDADEVYDTSSFPRREGSNGREHPGLSRRRTSGILGYSYAIEWDHGGERKEDETDLGTVEETCTAHGKVPSDGIIQQMFDLYPVGTIIYFEKQTLSANAPPAFKALISENPSPDTPSMMEEEIFLALQQFIPECASVLFMPLFHNSGKPYAASFSWTCNALRVFTSDELSYMQGFMSSIMSEVTRLNTLSENKSKGDFISSISHELRTPLHGVLASTEFLAETTLDIYQRRFVDTVENCGRMLLDTINHVLDFRKLTSLMRDQNMLIVGHSAEDAGALLAQPHYSSQESKVEPFNCRVVSLNEATDISALTEHVVECVYAGYEFKGISSLGFTEVIASAIHASSQPSDIGLLSNRSGLSNMRGVSHYARDAVTVILDFEKRDNWTFVTQPGAMRRILMNIFGKGCNFLVFLQCSD
jgi:signal transduction histidine kinase